MNHWGPLIASYSRAHYETALAAGVANARVQAGSIGLGVGFALGLTITAVALLRHRRVVAA